MGTLNDIPKIALATAERHGMFPADGPVVAMVSGGGDSIALLHLLASGVLGPTTADLAVLHVDHGLRGAESDADADFVRTRCAALGVPCTIARYDVATYAAESDLNLEDAGRRVRYRFAEEELDALCDARGALGDRGRIVTAHTRDDRVETFLMRLASGAGAGGLSAIPYVRGRIVRPLLDVSRDDLRAWLLERGIGWREDATNADLDRTRARVRAELLPRFRDLNRSFDGTLARTLDILAEEDSLLSAMAEQFARDFTETRSGHEVVFNRALMSTLSRAMLRRTVREAILAAFPDASRLEAEHVDAIVAGLGEERFARDLPNGLRAETRYDTLVVVKAGETPRAVAPSLLMIPGTADLGDAGSICAEEVPSDDVAGTPESVVVDASEIGDSFVVDGIRPGDRMRPLGMEGTRKLSDLLVDSKVPRHERHVVPVVRDGERIVWVAGVRMSEDYRVGPETTRAIRLTWRSR
jgi:tRNA(Ile)-lysidine synthase